MKTDCMYVYTMMIICVCVCVCVFCTHSMMTAAAAVKRNVLFSSQSPLVLVDVYEVTQTALNAHDDETGAATFTDEERAALEALLPACDRAESSVRNGDCFETLRGNIHFQQAARNFQQLLGCGMFGTSFVINPVSTLYHHRHHRRMIGRGIHRDS